MEILRLRTAAWYGDHVVTVPLPATWQVAVFRPQPLPALTDGQIAERFETPAGQARLRELGRGKARPLIIVDDLNRPTPAARIIPAILKQLNDAGISARDVTILMGPGTHGAPRPDALLKKVGPEAASLCRVVVHDCYRDLVHFGRTSFGTPILVNRQVAASDFVIGVGGLYPNLTAGFGGGSKLALGVLGFTSIAGLHFGHKSMGWGTPNAESNFRRDLDEIARRVGLRTTVSLLLNADREVVDIFCGDPWVAYPAALQMARSVFHAPTPTNADVVLSNAYPNDLWVTFVGRKGRRPLAAAPPGASRVVVAACPEGIGFHGLFPLLKPPGRHRRRLASAKVRVLLRQPYRQLPKVVRRLSRRFRPPASPAANPTWLFRPPAAEGERLPSTIAEIRVGSAWEKIGEAVTREQGGRLELQVAVYVCAALQWLG